MTVLISAITLAYSLLTLIFWIRWLQMKGDTTWSGESSANLPKVSVIMVVRNEEENILSLLQDLDKQTYAARLTEVWVVDDHSTDTTAAIIATYKQQATYTLYLLPLAEHIPSILPEGNYKKRGIELAVSQATGELIICTDGDCRVEPTWVQAISNIYIAKKPHFISGPVTFYNEKHLFEKLQTIEFASLIGSGAALLALGVPAMCNGANLAFTKKAFVEVGGYSHTSGTATGDDVFLLQKINKAFPGKVLFLQSQKAIVYTKAQQQFSDFVQQRKRWASKWNLYIDWRVSALAVFIFISNFSVIVALSLLLSGNYSMRMFLIQIAVKFSVEFVFLATVLSFLKKLDFVKFIFPLQILYVFYVSFFGIVTHKKGYSWKGRKLK
ncbi:glycosyltransferase family 2 protein [Rhodocytophaga aerolata]|uniref:Glycosyltransferase family 2 protein n=1 Tax=Rhodocytophaga aerolata TaxID=455078 RepID=A0ABT8R1H7_9BACT|nr:glycosyltransferase family 2 protein [Rhodocytophaga aerolata]MDO1445239.1 glycosyltransferase family 2 protein [Rhodocytophaga aerolata]